MYFIPKTDAKIAFIRIMEIFLIRECKRIGISGIIPDILLKPVVVLFFSLFLQSTLNDLYKVKLTKISTLILFEQYNNKSIMIVGFPRKLCRERREWLQLPKP